MPLRGVINATVLIELASGDDRFASSCYIADNDSESGQSSELPHVSDSYASRTLRIAS